jgi:hypothetical protein
MATLQSSPLSAGTPVRALDFPPSMQVMDRTSQLNLTNTSYATGTPEVAVRFQAPTSGRVLVTVSAGVRNNSATVDRVWVCFSMFEGDPNSGNQVAVEEVKYGVSNHAISDANDDFAYGSNSFPVSGLTPGTFYYARIRHKVTIGGGTADISTRGITVIPIP